MGPAHLARSLAMLAVIALLPFLAPARAEDFVLAVPAGATNLSVRMACNADRSADAWAGECLATRSGDATTSLTVVFAGWMSGSAAGELVAVLESEVDDAYTLRTRLACRDAGSQASCRVEQALGIKIEGVHLGDLGFRDTSWSMGVVVDLDTGATAWADVGTIPVADPVAALHVYAALALVSQAVFDDAAILSTVPWISEAS